MNELNILRDQINEAILRAGYTWKLHIVADKRGYHWQIGRNKYSGSCFGLDHDTAMQWGKNYLAETIRAANEKED